MPVLVSECCAESIIENTDLKAQRKVLRAALICIQEALYLGNTKQEIEGVIKQALKEVEK